MTDFRAAVVAAAMGEVGKSDPSVYNAVTYEPGQVVNDYWCVSFALWSLHQAGLTDFKFSSLHPFGSGFVYPLNLKQISVSNAQPGDIAYFSNLQHHAVVVSGPDLTGRLTVVNGNGTGGAVTLSMPYAENVTAVYSISTLVDAAESSSVVLGTSDSHSSSSGYVGVLTTVLVVLSVWGVTKLLRSKSGRA